jgi:hypothetical protein
MDENVFASNSTALRTLLAEMTCLCEHREPSEAIYVIRRAGRSSQPEAISRQDETAYLRPLRSCALSGQAVAVRSLVSPLLEI